MPRALETANGGPIPAPMQADRNRPSTCTALTVLGNPQSWGDLRSFCDLHLHSPLLVAGHLESFSLSLGFIGHFTSPCTGSRIPYAVCPNDGKSGANPSPHASGPKSALYMHALGVLGDTQGRND